MLLATRESHFDQAGNVSSLAARVQTILSGWIVETQSLCDCVQLNRKLLKASLAAVKMSVLNLWCSSQRQLHVQR